MSALYVAELIGPATGVEPMACRLVLGRSLGLSLE
jgi:hypothetical protein